MSGPLRKLSSLDKSIRNVILNKGLTIPYTFDTLNFEDASTQNKGLLLSSPVKKFLVVENILFTGNRAGPSVVSPVRHTGTLILSLYTKNFNKVPDTDFLEGIADSFANKTIDWIRFRVFTPQTPMMHSGFVVLSGAVDFDFELYRGTTP